MLNLQGRTLTLLKVVDVPLFEEGVDFHGVRSECLVLSTHTI